MSVQRMAARARDHWTKWLPKKVKSLKAEGIFSEATHGAAVMAQQEIERLQAQGYRPHEAEEVALKAHILLDPEPAADLEDWERKELGAKEAAYRKTPPT